MFRTSISEHSPKFENLAGALHGVQKSRILKGEDAFLQLQLKCIEEREASKFEPAESMKWSLIAKHKDLPQPATFHAHADWAVPLQHTLLPITRRRLLQELTRA